jgi:hypothetical protein
MNQFGLAADDAKYIPFRTGTDTGATSKACNRINDRMQGSRFGKSSGNVFHQSPAALTILKRTTQPIADYDGSNWPTVDKPGKMHLHTKAPHPTNCRSGISNGSNE